MRGLLKKIKKKKLWEGGEKCEVFTLQCGVCRAGVGEGSPFIARA